MKSDAITSPPGPDPGRVRDAVLAAIKEATLDAIWIVDREGRLLDFNSRFDEAFRATFGPAPQTSARFSDLVVAHSSEVRAGWENLHQRVLTGRSVLTEASMPIDGVPRRFSIHGTPLHDSGETFAALFMARDITEFRRSDSRDFLRTYLARLLAEEPAIPELLKRFIESFCTSVGCDMGVAWLEDETGKRLLPVASWAQGRAASELEDSLRGLSIAPGEGLAGHVWSSEQPLWIADLADETMPLRPSRAVPSDARSAILFPIRDSTRVVGVLATFMRRTHVVESRLLESFGDIGLSIGRYIERRAARDEQDRLQTALERKGHEWTMTFDAIDSPLMILDTDGTMIRVNHAARELAGFSKYSDLLGRNLSSLIGEPHWRTVYEAVTTVRELQTSYSLQFHDDARNRYWDMSVSYARAQSSVDDKIIVILRDVSSLIELQNSVRRSEQLSAMGELVAGVAHEVRNPLFGMQVAVDALEMSVLTDDGRELIQALRTWVDRLNHLMSQLLEYGKTWTMNLREGDISDVLKQAIESCSLLASGSQVTIRSDVRDEAPILLDPGRLVQVFQNLITNAVQFSPKGEVVDVELRRAARDGAPLVECVVRDRGVGFQANDLSRVFQPFFTRRRGGTGLGLSIVQRIVDEHGGTVSASNHPSGGGMVTVSFPPVPPRTEKR